MKNILKNNFILLLIVISLVFVYGVGANLSFYPMTKNLSVSEFDKSTTANVSVKDAPKINARHAIVLDRSSKQILFGKSEKEACKMASTTKIMTATVIIENCNLKDTVTVSSKAAHTGGSRLGLSTNDTITVENLLYGLMLRSGNDAAVALAEFAGGSIEGFADMMNAKASELHLSSTHFVTPHGLDNDNHYTSAYDLAILTDYALKNEVFAKIVATKNRVITLNGHSKSLSNTNELLGNFYGVYGVKTGFTNGANRCLVTACKRDNLDVICIVLGCDTKKNRTNDSTTLLNYVCNNFSMVNVEDFINSYFETWALENKDSFVINKGVSNELDLSLAQNSLPFKTTAINNMFLDSISADISFNPYHQAPLASNTVIGKLNFNVNGINYFCVNIVNTNSICNKSVFDYLTIMLSNYCSYFNSLLSFI